MPQSANDGPSHFRDFHDGQKKRRNDQIGELKTKIREQGISNQKQIMFSGNHEAN